MSILEILWVVTTIALLLLSYDLCKRSKSECIMSIGACLYSLCAMVIHWIDILTKPLW